MESAAVCTDGARYRQDSGPPRPSAVQHPVGVRPVSEASKTRSVSQRSKATNRASSAAGRPDAGHSPHSAEAAGSKPVRFRASGPGSWPCAVHQSAAYRWRRAHFGCLEAGAWAQIVVFGQLCDMDCGRGYRRVAWWLGSGNPVAEMTVSATSLSATQARDSSLSTSLGTCGGDATRRAVAAASSKQPISGCAPARPLDRR
jgi:hypothetical protein